jgi:hypothetical protein
MIRIDMRIHWIDLTLLSVTFLLSIRIRSITWLIIFGIILLMSVVGPTKYIKKK